MYLSGLARLKSDLPRQFIRKGVADLITLRRIRSNFSIVLPHSSCIVLGGFAILVGAPLSRFSNQVNPVFREARLRRLNGCGYGTVEIAARCVLLAASCRPVPSAEASHHAD